MKVISKIASLLLAVVFIASSIGFNVATHYCGDTIHKQNISFGESDLTCGMETSQDSPCETTFSDNCCKNDVQTYKVKDDYENPSSTLDVNTSFIIALVNSYINISNVTVVDNTEYLVYSPPLLERDIPVLIQSFLI